nr:MAG TPA: hypothetical protein [Caudoviricetes sp.]
MVYLYYHRLEIDKIDGRLSTYRPFVYLFNYI